MSDTTQILSRIDEKDSILGLNEGNKLDWLALMTKKAKSAEFKEDVWILTYPNNSTLKDFGKGIEATGEITDDMIKDIVLAIKEKGWSSASLHGTYDFKERVALEVKRQNLKVFIPFTPKNFLDFQKKLSYITDISEGENANDKRELQAGHGGNGANSRGDVSIASNRPVLQRDSVQDSACEIEKTVNSSRSSMSDDLGAGNATAKPRSNGVSGGDTFCDRSAGRLAVSRITGNKNDVLDSIKAARYTNAELKEQFNNLSFAITKEYKHTSVSEFAKLADSDALKAVSKLDKLSSIFRIALSKDTEFLAYASSARPFLKLISGTAKAEGLAEAVKLFDDREISALIFALPAQIQHQIFNHKVGVIDKKEVEEIRKKILNNQTTEEENLDLHINALSSSLKTLNKEKKDAGLFSFSAKRVLSEQILAEERALKSAKERRESPDFWQENETDRKKRMYAEMPVHTSGIELVCKEYDNSPRVALALYVHGPEFASAVLGGIVKNEMRVKMVKNDALMRAIADLENDPVKIVPAAPAPSVSVLEDDESKPETIQAPAPAPGQFEEFEEEIVLKADDFDIF